MADVICLSSDDEDELVFTEVESGEDLDAKPEAIQAVFLPENLPDCLSPDSEVYFGNLNYLANEESTLSVAPTESTIEDPFSSTNDEETTLQDVAFPELINENPLPSLDGGNMPEQEHSQSDKCLKLKLLAEQLAKTLSISKEKISVIKKNNLLEGKTSRLFQRDSEKTIKSKSKGGRRGRPPHKNVIKYNESKRNVSDNTRKESQQLVESNSLISEKEGLPLRIDLKQQELCYNQEEGLDSVCNTEKSKSDRNVKAKNGGKGKRRKTQEPLESTSTYQNKKKHSTHNASYTVEVQNNNIISPQNTENSMSAIENPERIKQHFNLTPTPNVEKFILQVSQGHFGSEYRTEFRDKKDNKRPCERAENLEDFNSLSKKLKDNEVRCETITSNSFDEKCSSLENPENLHHEEHTCQSVVDSFIEKHFMTTVPNGSRKSILLNKNNSSPGRKHNTSCESQTATLNQLNESQSKCENCINNQSFTSLNTETTSLIERLNQSDCVHVSVIKYGNTIPSTSTENVSKQQQDTVNQTRLNPSDKIASSTASKSNKPNQDKRLSIMVKSPLSINKDHDESNVHSYLPTFSESFTHTVRSEFHSNDMNVQNNHKQPDKKQAFSHNPTVEHGQFMRAANGIDDSNPWNLQTLHSHSTQNPSFCHKPTPNQNLLEHRKGRNQSERFNPVDRSPLPNKTSENQRHNQPLQWLGSPPNYVLNHHNHSQPSRTTSDKQRWRNDSQIPYRTLIGGNAQYPSTNSRYRYNHQVNIQPNHIFTNSPVVYDKSKPSAQPGTLGHPPVNQPTSTVSAHSQIETDTQRYVSKSNNPQNMQYYQEGQNQTTLNHAMNYDKTCGPDLNSPQSFASQYAIWPMQYGLHYAWLEHYYKKMYNRGGLVYPTTPVSTASVQNLHKPPPPYTYPVNPRVNMRVPSQPTSANTMKNQGYFDQTTSGNFQRSHLKPVQNWSCSNQLADLTVPNQTVSMGVPVDSNVTIKPFYSNVTIKNCNFTNYGSSPTVCNYGPQNYDLPLSAENTLHPQPTKPPN